MASLDASNGDSPHKQKLNMNKNRVACVPKYCNQIRPEELSPGLQFGLYWRLWNSRDWQICKEELHPISLRKKQSELLKSLQERQKAMFASATNSRAFVAETTSPFITGIGNEHPLENGFSFLNPYGLPYLPGSGVKGVLRRAAEELIHQEFFPGSLEYSLVDIWHLFGFEKIKFSWCEGFHLIEEDVENFVNAYASKLKDRISHKKLRQKLNLIFNEDVHTRGALQFWDVFPTCDRLEFDIMTPHYPEYFQYANTGIPHDLSDPTPIRFLTIPVGAKFTFYINADESRLEKVAPHLVESDKWVSLIEQMFDHAFDWQGFGAKTAVGYGAMNRLKDEEKKLSEEDLRRKEEVRKRAEKQDQLENMSLIEREVEKVYENRSDKGMPKFTCIFVNLRDGKWTGEEKIEVAKILKSCLKKVGKWKESSKKKNPKKDKDYIRTKQVINWIEGK